MSTLPSLQDELLMLQTAANMLKLSQSVILRSLSVIAQNHNLKIDHLIDGMAKDKEQNHNKYEKIIENKIRDRSHAGITMSELYNKTRSIPVGIKNKILEKMISENKVYKSKTRLANSRKKTTLIFWKE